MFRCSCRCTNAYSTLSWCRSDGIFMHHIDGSVITFSHTCCMQPNCAILGYVKRTDFSEVLFCVSRPSTGSHHWPYMFSTMTADDDNGYRRRYIGDEPPMDFEMKRSTSAPWFVKLFWVVMCLLSGFKGFLVAGMGSRIGKEAESDLKCP